MIFKSVPGMPAPVREALIKVATDRTRKRAWEHEGALCSPATPEEFAQGLMLSARWEYDALVEAWKTQEATRAAKRETTPMRVARSQELQKAVSLDDVVEMNEGELIGKTEDGVRVFLVKGKEVALDAGGEFIVETADRLIGGRTSGELLTALGEE